MEYLTDSAVTQIQSETKQTSEVFARVDKFNIEQQTPTQTRDSLVTEIHGRADQLYTIASPWIPFLAYQKGDVAKNIEALTSSVGQAQTLIESAKVTIQARQSEIEGIITQAREASAAAGAAVFTQDFKNEAVSLDDQARKWLYLTASGAALTLLFAIIVWLFPIAGDDVPSIAQRFGGKLAALVAVSYTHLDVYKRQVSRRAATSTPSRPPAALLRMSLPAQSRSVNSAWYDSVATVSVAVSRAAFHQRRQASPRAMPTGT